MNSSHIPRILALLLLAAFLLSFFPAIVIADQEQEATEAVETTVDPIEVDPTQETEQETEELLDVPDVQDAEAPSELSTEPAAEPAEPTEETGVETTEHGADPSTEEIQDPTELEEIKADGPALMTLLANGTFVPYTPKLSGADAPNYTRDVPSGIYYSDIFGAHSSDLNGINVKAGGSYLSFGYGESWFPLGSSDFSKELSFDGQHYVCIGAMYSNRGPSYYMWYEVGSEYYLGIPIRPSQEDGHNYSDPNFSWEPHTISNGVPNYLQENLKTCQIPTYTSAEFTQINLIYAVANGMGAMRGNSGDANLTAAATTLIMNTVFGYIGLGSDGLYHGLPICTTSDAVNQRMVEILVRCEVYSKEKGLTGSMTGDNTVNRLKAKLSYTPTDTTGWYVKSGTASSSSMSYFQITQSHSSGNQIYIWATNAITFDNAPKTVTIKKTSSASASVLACIQGNPLYSLQGAVYEIHQGSENGPVVATLITNANGEATSAQTFAIGTVLYAKEITAPPGYLLNSTSVPLTVSANDSQNVFNVSDVPAFDPEVLEVKKAGTDNRYIAGAIFKAEFYASTRPTGTPDRTWYFQSDSNGLVKFDGNHFASGYTSSELFKPYGDAQGAMFPLGCIKVTEIKAANGYILPSGNAGTAYIYIRQSGNDTTAAWGDAQGNSTSNLGMYTITNDAVTAVNEETGTMTMRKTLPDDAPGGKDGYCFNVFRLESQTTWYGRSDSNGNIYKTNSNHTAVAEGQRVYTFEGMEDGTYAIRELLSLREDQNTKTQRIRITTSGGSTAPIDLILEGNDLGWDNNGDCIVGNLAVTGLNDGGTMSIEITNVPITGEPFSIKKIDPSSEPLEGAIFKVDYFSASWSDPNASEKRTWYFTTDGSGYFTLEAAYLVDESDYPEYPSDELFPIDQIPLGIMEVREVKAPEGYIKSDAVGVWRIKLTNPATFAVSSYWAEDDGDTPTTSYGDDAYILATDPSMLYVRNTPGNELEIVKTSSNGRVDNITFTVEYFITGVGWFPVGSTGTYVTDTNGKINIPQLTAGTQVRITEIVPTGSVCLSENPQTVTLQVGKTTVNFENADISLEIVKTSSNGRIRNISFEVEKFVNGNWTMLGTYVTGTNGKIAVEPEHMALGARFRIREIVPQGSICLSENPQIVTLAAGVNTVNFENKDISLEIVKTSTDGNVSGIQFTVEKRVSGSWSMLGTYVTGTNGKFSIETEHLAIGAQFRIKEIVPDNYICLSTNPQTITLVEGKNTVTFENKPNIVLELVKHSDDGNIEGIEFILAKRNFAGIFITQGTYVTDAEGKIYVSDLEQGATYRITETVPEGYYCDNPMQTFTAQLGTNTVTFENHPIVTLRIVKTSTDGAVDGISFTVERHEGAASGNTHSNKDRWIRIGTYVTADGGIILIDAQGLLHVGDELRITETVPENYICLSENPQRITLVKGENTVQFENKPGVSLDILKQSDDGNISGIRFTVEKKKGGEDYAYVGEYVTGRNGQIHIEDLEVGGIYRITETLPYGYTNEHVSQEVTIHLGTNSVTFVNRLILGSIKIVKVEEGARTPLEGAGFRLYDERGEEIGKGLTDENGELIFEDLRVGSYTVKEFRAPEGFELDETEIPLELTPDAPDIEIERENKIIPGLIRVLKKNDQGQAMRRVTYLLEYSLDDTNTWLPVQYRNPESPVQAGYCTSEGLENGMLPTGPDGIVEYTGLAVNNQLHTIKYRLTEVETQSGYELLAEPVFEGFLTGEQAEVAYEVVNHHIFEMPLTGGSGFTLTAIGSVLAVLLALGILLHLPKKRKNNM